MEEEGQEAGVTPGAARGAPGLRGGGEKPANGAVLGTRAHEDGRQATWEMRASELSGRAPGQVATCLLRWEDGGRTGRGGQKSSADGEEGQGGLRNGEAVSVWAEAELLAVGGDRPLDRESSGQAREGAADGVRCGPGAGTRDRAVTGTGALLSKGGREGEETPWRGLTLPQLGLLGAPSPQLPWGGGGRARPRASGPRALSGTDQLRLRSHE